MKIFSSLLAVVVLGGLAVGNQDDVKTAQPLDRDFLIKAATCNNAAIQVSKLADNRAQSTQVKEFATMIVKDHKHTGDQLSDLLKGRKLAIAAGFDKETTDEVKRLSKLEGQEFDRAYLQCMVKGHKEAIAMLENQVKNGKQEDISSYATQVLSHMRKHLTKAEELSKNVVK